MSVNPISSAFVVNAASSQDKLQTIEVSVKTGQTLSPKQFLEQVVMKALGTHDQRKAAAFLHESGLEQHVLPPPRRENGHSVYAFKTNDKFWKSIENFKQTGKALALTTTAKTAPNHARNTAKATVTLETIAQVQTQNRQPGFRASRDTVRQGKDGGLYNVPINPAEFVDLKTGKTKVADGDERKEFLAAAVYAAAKDLGYGADVVEQVLRNYSDENSVTLGGQTASETDIRKILVESARAGKLVDFGLAADLRQNLYRLEINLRGSEKEKLQLRVDDELARIDQKYAQSKPQNDVQKVALELAKNNEKKAAVDRLVNEAKDVRAPNGQTETLINQGVDFLEKAIRASVDANPVYAFLPEEAKKQITDFGIGIARGTVGLVAAGKGVEDFFHDAATDALLYTAKQTGLDKKLGIDVDKIQQDLNVQRRAEAKMWTDLTSASTARIAKNELAFELKTEAGLKLNVFDTPNWAVKGGEITAQAVPFIAVGIATGGASIPASMAIAGGTSGLMALGGTYSTTRKYEPAMKAAVLGTVQGAVMPLAGKLGLPGEAVANVAFAYTVGKLQGKTDAQIQQDIVLQLAQAGAFRAGSKLQETLAARSGKPLATEADVKAEFQKQASDPKFLQTIKEEVAVSAGKQTERFVRQTEVETVAKNLESQRNNSSSGNQNRAANAKVGELHSNGVSARARIGTQAKEIFENWGKNNRVVTRARAEQASLEIRKYVRQSMTQLNSGVDPSVFVPMAKRAAFHIEAGARSFAEFSRVMTAEFGSAIKPRLEQLYKTAIAKENIQPDDADIQAAKQQSAPSPEEAKLLAIREKLSPAAQDQFDLMRMSHNNDAKFAEIVGKNSDPAKMFEGMAESQARKAQSQAQSQANFEQARADILNNQEFLQSAEVRKIRTNVDSNARIKDLRAAISVELVKQELINQYSPAEGYQVMSEVDLYQDTGYATKADYYKDNPGGNVGGMEEINNRLWRKVTDLDVVVVKPDANGRLQFIELEQIKSGDGDSGGKAKLQMQNSLRALENARTVDILVRRNSDKAVLENINPASVTTAKQITRGIPGKAGFDKQLPVNASQMNQIAKEIDQIR